MNSILCDILFVFAYLDDILVNSRTEQEHETHLHQVFHLLSDNGMVIIRKKSMFSIEELTYLGHQLTPSGIMPLKSRVQAMNDFPVPISKASLQCFLGMINY